MNQREQEVVDKAIQNLSEEIRVTESVLANLKEARNILARYRGIPPTRDAMSGVEVCDYLKVRRTSLARYMAGQLPPNKPPFPKPIESVGKVKYWAKEDIITWKSSFHEHT